MSTPDTEATAPIKNFADISKIKKSLEKNTRNLSLFTIGINVALRGSDLLALKVGQVRHLKEGDTVAIKEGKTGKVRNISFNASAVDAAQRLIASMTDPQDEDLLFQSRKQAPRKAVTKTTANGTVTKEPGTGQLTIQQLNRLVKLWCSNCRKAQPKDNFGSHSLRKTWAYHQRVTYEVELPKLTEILGHSSQAVTLRYICHQPEEIHNVYMNCL